LKTVAPVQWTAWKDASLNCSNNDLSNVMLDSNHSLAYAICGGVLTCAILLLFLLLPECDQHCASGCDAAGADNCDSSCLINYIFNNGNCDGLCTHAVLRNITSIY